MADLQLSEYRADSAGMDLGSAILGLLCVGVLLETGLMLRNLAHLRLLHGIEIEPLTTWPRVSVIMTARDEAADVAESVVSRLADDYPDIEVILVDDRSADGTGAMARTAARGDHRFTLVRVDELPPGWLGKVHALQMGFEHARGDWLLFSDGDVVVETGTLRDAVGLCETEGIDQLALIPSFSSGSRLMDGAWVVFLRGLIMLADPAKVRDPESRVVLGSGGFNLVRRTVFEKTGGFDHIRMETADDVALAAMVKKAGGRIEVIDGSRHASLTMYRSLRELFRGIEKNGSTTAAIPFPLFVLSFMALGLVLFAPFAAMTAGPIWLFALGLSAFSVYTGSQMYALWRNAGRWAPALVWPAGFLIMAFAMIRATWLAHRNGGVYWRDTFYTLDELEAGRRFTFI
jgi:cellulose synthase/poly-beta-1,6-N-acetylglucosamine synthase-like glycosyltransferase